MRADFFGFAVAREPELAHRVDDAALHRLEPVADERQRAVEDDVHRVVEVRALGVFRSGICSKPWKTGRTVSFM